VSHCYQPLDYAWRSHCLYLERYGCGEKKILFLGMNPGPYGMTQTGVPFGEIAAVRDWMKISAVVDTPKNPHPKRAITGFQCDRSEVSGRRLWGLFAERFPVAGDFFQHHFVANYCPLVWMSASGANITPDKISAAEIAPVEQACMEHLRRVIDILQPEWLIGVGAYAEQRLILASTGSGRKTGKILHPSPASPAANRDWPGTATRQLTALGIWTQQD
ncbi:MAG: single-stranded DNA-binding protein, partial [Verrucomicrobia bacterium]|nr:single-stranded DNA-binding protein [Verrucomicrobiota bacterium]